MPAREKSDLKRQTVMLCGREMASFESHLDSYTNFVAKVVSNLVSHYIITHICVLCLLTHQEGNK